MRRVVALMLSAWFVAATVWGAITNVAVQTTHRQAVISYTAPDLSGCAVDVYQNAGRTQEVNDTKPAIFGGGANQDNRMGSVSSGRRRNFVAGQIPLPGWSGYNPTETTSSPLTINTASRASNVATIVTGATHGLNVYDHVTVAGVGEASFNAADALVTSTPTPTSFTYGNPGSDGSSSGGTATRVNRFSRTLQADTQHWFRITCGADTYDGTFRTANIPLGSTYGELTAFDWSSAPMKYIYPAIPAVRPYTTIDPVTGISAHRATLASDCTACGALDTPTSFDAGNQVSCPAQKTNGGYRCTVQSRQSLNRLYWYGDDGSVRFLGYMRYSAGAEWGTGYAPPQAFWDANDPNIFWVLAQNSVLGAMGVLKLTYTGNDAAVPADTAVQWTATNMTPSAAGKSLSGLIHDFDARFAVSTYTSCVPSSVQGDYLTGICRSKTQDSPAWIWALYLGDRLPLGSCSDCLRVVAAAPMFGNAKTRWCGSHFTNQIPVSNVQHFIVQKLAGAGATGPWEVVLQGDIDNSTSSLTVSGEPVCNASSLPFDGSTYLQDAAVGDVFMFGVGGERIKITNKVGTSWTVQRGYADTTKVSHSAGAVLRALCEPIEVVSLDDFFWRYLDDPHGTDTTNAYWRQDSGMYNSHRVERSPWDVMAGWSIRYGNFPDNNFDGAPTTGIIASPVFAGTKAGADGNAYQKHPAYENWNAADASRREWFTDLTPFQIDPALNRVGYSKIGATSYIYKIVPSGTWPVNVKGAPMIGISGTNVLLDISGPSSALADTTGDAYKFCVAYKAGECWPASATGETYANLPTAVACASGEGYIGQSDFCAFHVPAYGQAVMQFGLDGKSHRALIRGLSGLWRAWGSLTNARSTPDGKWLVFPTNIDSNASGFGLPGMVAQIPDTPAWESTNRTDFIPVTVMLGGMAGASRTLVEFGYAPDGNYRCTQRAETCVAAASTYNPTTPYYFANTDTYAGIDCSAGCSIVVPAISGRAMYWRVKYRDAAANVMAVTRPQIVTTP